MSKLFFLFAACACAAVASGAMVRREAPAAAAAPNALQELEKHAQEFQKTFNEQLNALTNSKNTQDFQKALQDGSNNVLQQLSTLSNSLQGALSDANGKAKEALEGARAGLQRTADELRKSHPEVEEHANQLKDKLQLAVQNTLKESQKLAKEVSATVEANNQKLAPKIKEAYDEFVKQADQIQKKLHEAATKTA